MQESLFWCRGWEAFHVRSVESVELIEFVLLNSERLLFMPRCRASLNFALIPAPPLKAAYNGCHAGRRDLELVMLRKGGPLPSSPLLFSSLPSPRTRTRTSSRRYSQRSGSACAAAQFFCFLLRRRSKGLSAPGPLTGRLSPAGLLHHPATAAPGCSRKRRRRRQQW